MREIKFRAWDNEDKKMWKVVAISESIWGDCEEAHISICEFDKSPGDKETNVRLSVDFDLMQYTGLKDSNGREIYEGDIVKRTYESGTVLIGDVVFEEATYFIREDDGYAFLVSQYNSEENVVISNIYENPELIKGVNV